MAMGSSSNSGKSSSSSSSGGKSSGGMNSGGGFGSPGGGRSGGNSGNSSTGNSGSNSSGGKSSSASSAAGSTSAGKSDRSSMSGSLSAGPTSTAASKGGTSATGAAGNSGGNAGNAGGKSAASTSAAASGSVMGGLKSAVDSARSEKSNLSQSIGNQVSKTMGTDSSHPNAGVTAPNATPAQKDAYMGGYRDQTNASLTGSTFGSVAPGVGSLVGAGLSKAMTMGDKGMAPENAAAYSTGRTGAKDAGISSGVRGMGTALAGVLGGPIMGALTNAALGVASYNMQRSANPQAFSGAAPQSMGPVGGTGINGAAGPGNGGGANGGSALSAASPTMASTLSTDDTYGGAPSDYSEAYNSYHAMNLGKFNG